MKYLPLLFLLLFSCQGNGPSRPDNLLTEEQMAQAMAEIIILEQQVAEARIEKPAALDSFNRYEKIIFAEMGIDSAAYYASYNYYLLQPEIFFEITTIATDSIGKQRDLVAPEQPGNEQQNPAN